MNTVAAKTSAVCSTPVGLAVPDKKSRTIENLRSRIAARLHIPSEDADLIDVTLAVFKSHEIPGDPLWCIIVDASGGGKTELLRGFRKRPNAYFLSNLTEKTLVSGYRDPDRPKEDPSLLPQLDGKVLVIKDLSPLLSMRRESRSVIISQLRDAYDGFTDEGRGNTGKQSYEARFSLLAAGTLALDRADAFDDELGERFIKFRCCGDANKQKVRKAISNIGSDEDIRNDIEAGITDFLDSLPAIESVPIPEELEEKLVSLADFTARARSHVSRDKNGDLQYYPRPEVGTRLGKELGKLLVALSAVRGRTEPDAADFLTVQRVADDCLPPNRLAVINALRNSGKPRSVSDLVKIIGLSDKTVRRILDDLRVLKVCKPERSGLAWSEHDEPDVWILDARQTD